MFINTFLSFIFCFLCLFTILLVLMQRGKGNMGLGNVGGNNQMLFGSSGGQDIFQKITWACCVLLLASSLILAIFRGKQPQNYKSLAHRMPIAETANQSIPQEA